MNMHKFNPLQSFARDDRASLSVEAVLVLPLLLWAFLATFTFFDVYRVRNLALKANYAVSDLLSRETNFVDTGYIAGIDDVYEYLTQGAPGSIRVTPVRCTEECDQEDLRVLVRDWSSGTDSYGDALTDEQVNAQYRDVIPMIPLGERVIMVESRMTYWPTFSTNLTGIGSQVFTDVVMTRPRFAPQLCWTGLSCDNPDANG